MALLVGGGANIAVAMLRAGVAAPVVSGLITVLALVRVTAVLFAVVCAVFLLHALAQDRYKRNDIPSKD